MRTTLSKHTMEKRSEGKILHCTKTTQNEIEIVQWRLLCELLKYMNLSVIFHQLYVLKNCKNFVNLHKLQVMLYDSNYCNVLQIYCDTLKNITIDILLEKFF